jgi:hypothetical protein
MLAIAVVGSMALTPALAHAEGEFHIGSKTLKELKLASETVAGSLKTAFNYSVPKLGFEINCGAVDISSKTPVTSEILQSGVLDAEFFFLECTTLGSLTKEESPACAVEDTANHITGAIAIRATGQVLLHEGKTYLLFSPISGGAFTTLLFKNKECVLTGEHPITGTFAAEVGADAKALPLKLLGAEAETLLGDNSFFSGLSKAFFSGTLLLSLSGTNSGQIWGAS